MTADSISALRKIARAQMKFAYCISSALGQTIANELTDGYKDLLKALDTEKIEAPVAPPKTK